TPLHLVLMADMQRPIVLTSGNRSEEPQVTENGEALERLSEIADLWLMNDRDIVNRLDDSVVRISAGARRTIRRARGIAPAPMILPEGFSAAPRVLAMGGALKNTFCLLGDGKAIVSQHMGDMENPRAHADYRRNMKLYRDINGFEADIIALDMHPDYIPSQWGRKLAEEANIPVVPVQHHHAHVAAVMAEHGLEKDTSPVFGIVFDGLGYGPDGDLWGGEFLIVDYAHFRRVAHFAPVPLIGGEKAMVQPWRNAFAHINAAIGWEIAAKNFKNLSLLRQFEEKPLAQVKQMLKRGLNVPPASSAGRLFDGVAAALGICFDQLSFEGEAAIGLENLALQCQDDVGGYRVAADDEISWKKLWQGILGDLDHGVSREVIARRFHNTVIQVTVHLAEKLQRTEGFSQVVLSGGVFQNNILLSEISRQLGERGMEVLSPMAFPANDGGLSLGQAAVAAARHINMERPE
ncbi:MAG: carbamoyltransferase HypF, partial [Rhodospirillales bacterium]|nr:carbamoyltransferase HypF [Rhodospirillales bacterium]